VVLVSSAVRAALIQATEVSPLTLVGVGGVLLSTTLAASLVPALRAASLDPAEVLRRD
jgi:ABC-type lipoprotein release transport system permease subunit